MKVVGAVEAKSTFGSLLDLVEKGEEITITRDGKPVARLVGTVAEFDRDKVRKAIGDIRKMRQGVTLGGIAIRDLIDEGRR